MQQTMNVLTTINIHRQKCPSAFSVLLSSKLASVYKLHRLAVRAPPTLQVGASLRPAQRTGPREGEWGRGVGKVSPRLSCCGLQEQTLMGLELDCSDVLAAVQRVPGVPHLHPCCSGCKDDLKAVVLLIVEFLVPPA